MGKANTKVALAPKIQSINSHAQKATAKGSHRATHQPAKPPLLRGYKKWADAEVQEDDDQTLHKEIISQLTGLCKGTDEQEIISQLSMSHSEEGLTVADVLSVLATTQRSKA